MALFLAHFMGKLSHMCMEIHIFHIHVYISYLSKIDIFSEIFSFGEALFSCYFLQSLIILFFVTFNTYNLVISLWFLFSIIVIHYKVLRFSIQVIKKVRTIIVMSLLDSEFFIWHDMSFLIILDNTLRYTYSLIICLLNWCS